MDKIKEFLEIGFNATMIILAFIVIVEIGSEAYKNIRISNKIQNTDICIKLNNEIYCRLDYNINIQKA